MKQPRNKTINNNELIVMIMMSNIMYIFMYYFIFSIKLDSIIYAIIHSILSVILSYFMYSEIQNSYIKNKFSATSITLIIANVYFMISSIKYTQESLYPGFISDNRIRLVGSVLVFFSILIATSWWKRLNKKRKSIIYFNNQKLIINKNIVYLFIFLYLGFTILSYIKNPVSNYLTAYQSPTSKEQFFSLINITLRNLLILSSVMIYEKKIINKQIQLVIVMSVFLFNSMVTGSRSALISPLFLIVYIMIRENKIKFKTIIYALCFSPVGYIIFTTIIFITSGRIGTFRNKGIAWDIAYRFDFSDFPMTILTRTKMIFIDLGQIMDGLSLSIPSIFWPNKLNSIGKNSQVELLVNSGLSPITDYTDSFFSMGAEFAGVLGLIFLFPILVYIFEKIDYRLSKKGNLGLVIIAIIFDLFTRIEIPWINFIPSLRDKILSIIIGLLLYKIFLRIREKKCYEFTEIERNIR